MSRILSAVGNTVTDIVATAKHRIQYYYTHKVKFHCKRHKSLIRTQLTYVTIPSSFGEGSVISTVGGLNSAGTTQEKED